MAKDEIEAMIFGIIFGIVLIWIGSIFLNTNATGTLATFYNNVGWGFIFIGFLLIGITAFILVKHTRDNKTF
jgi:membrane protein CcdC involved in cytochrome C biogenesis